MYDETTPSISFDENGICNYCHQYDDLCKQYPVDEVGRKRFQDIIDKIKKEGKGKKYDCVVGVSGGTDSSYMVYMLKDYGLRPIAVHYDNTWNYAVANQNIQKVLGALNVDLFTYVVHNEEVDDIFRSFLKASVPEIDASSDIGLASVLYIAAEKFGVQYVFEGHSFRAEGVAPLGWSYMDGRYIQAIQKRFGTMPIKTFPNMTFFKMIKWTGIKRIRKIRPFWYLDYNKADAKKFLTEKCGWEDYGGHHMENRISRFGHGYYLPNKFKMDQRKNAFGAAVRAGKMSREEAKHLLTLPRDYTEDELQNFIKRLKLTRQEFDMYMAAPNKTYKDYPTYKKRFERLKPMFYLMYKANLIPQSFYMKYCSKSK